MIALWYGILAKKYIELLRANSTNSRYRVSTCFAYSNGKTINPARTSGPTRCSLNSNWVTTPKLPPPPRIARDFLPSATV